MLKALLRKQLMELLSSMTRGSKKSNKKLTYIVLLVCLVMFGFIFFGLSQTLYDSFVPLGLLWLYFAVLGGISVISGIIGSVFSTYSMLYQAKDNELLLSMPIKPSIILFVRMISVYIMCFIFQIVVIIPAFIVYFMNNALTVQGVFALLTAIFVLPMMTLVLSCILGYLIALLASKLNNTNAVITVIYVLFLGLYLYCYTQMSSLIAAILSNAQQIGGFIKTFLYPLYLFGCGAKGDALSLALFVLIAFAVFALIYAIISHSFLKLATTKKGITQKAYREKSIKASSPFRALLRKEMKKFVSSPIYMFNCGIGSVMLVVVLIFGAINADVISKLTLLLNKDVFSLIACGGIMLISAVNYITAPSISLEGKNIWIVKSLPVLPWQIFEAKIALHLIITLPAVFIASLGFSYILKFSAFECIAVLLCCALFVLLCALWGLYINLKLPKLDYVSEAVVIKQSMSTFLGMFVPWAYIMLAAALYFITGNILDETVFLMCITAITLILCFVFYRSLKTKGAERFNSL